MGTSDASKPIRRHLRGRTRTEVAEKVATLESERAPDLPTKLLTTPGQVRCLPQERRNLNSNLSGLWTESRHTHLTAALAILWTHPGSTDHGRQHPRELDGGGDLVGGARTVSFEFVAGPLQPDGRDPGLERTTHVAG